MLIKNSKHLKKFMELEKKIRVPKKCQKKIYTTLKFLEKSKTLEKIYNTLKVLIKNSKHLKNVLRKFRELEKNLEAHGNASKNS